MAFFLSSFRYADNVCSGKATCEISTPTLILHSQPCPLELSSYFEASFKCVAGILNNCQLHFIFMQSFANKECSGKESCQIRVHDLIPHFKPCPVELSSFMETSYKCLGGKTVVFNDRFAKLCSIEGYSRIFVRIYLLISLVMRITSVLEKVAVRYQREI